VRRAAGRDPGGRPGDPPAEGRDYDEIAKTVLYVYDVGEKGENVQRIIDGLGRFAELGFTEAIGRVKGAHRPDPLRLIGVAGHPGGRRPVTAPGERPAA